ncbi:MAG: SDR family NAD(P)-dependent oxidoreductase [Candidatus Bathyarchaeia archaeon]|nr:SDR family oxidoreductase [Candidatus Bathyarchaeota archaeon]
MNGVKTLLITGASKGIGKVTAQLFAENGYDVAVNYNTDAKGANEAAEYIRKVGRRALVIQADVSDSRQVEELVRRTVEGLGRIDILVNNAAIQSMFKIEELSEEVWDRTIDVNLKSAFLCCKAVVPIMKKQKGGKIINISSVAARNGGILGPHYASSKAGMLGLTRYLAKELAPFNILVNSVTPALIGDAGSIATMSEEQKEALRRQIPLGRLGRSIDVAKAILFLAENDFVTGQTIDVNGGWYIT